MNRDDDINDYLPSLLNPRTVRKTNGDLTLTQHSIASCRSLSLKRKNGCSILKPTVNQICNNINNDVSKKKFLDVSNKSNFCSNKTSEDRRLIPAVEDVNPVRTQSLFTIFDKENSQNFICQSSQNLKNQWKSNIYVDNKLKDNSLKGASICLSAIDAIEDLSTILVGKIQDSNSFGFDDIEIPNSYTLLNNNCANENKNHSLISISSATELNDPKDSISDCETSTSTVQYAITEKAVLSVSFGVTNCDNVNLSTKNSSIKRIDIKTKNNTTEVDCDIVECSSISVASSTDENMNELSPSPPKKSAVSINLEIKKKNGNENSKLLFLNTNDIANLSHVIVQPPNCKLVKQQILDPRKFKKKTRRRLIDNKNGKIAHVDSLKQKRIDSYFGRIGVNALKGTVVATNGTNDMSKVAGIALGGKTDSPRSSRIRRDVSTASPRSAQYLPKRTPELHPARRHSARNYNVLDVTRIPSPKNKNSAESGNSTPTLNVNSSQPQETRNASNKKKFTLVKSLPLYKIVAGTHFAVDAFSYGDIPTVTHYFLTHFHSDHYAGLKKNFNKTLYCSKVTADLCTSRLGVNPNYIHILNYDESVMIDGVEVTALDANHCPGAIMLVFSLPNGKTMLHTGDFRASPLMESFPIFWNKDINTIYLDTTYCNPRYDFPTQEQSLEMALYILRQKKLAVEQAGRKFSSVLIICGTYTIGKEKFFLGMARRVGCSVWACPEKDRVLQTVEGRSFGHAPPTSCQLHVVPMRDLTHEKLKAYLDSMQGAFTEVVAFKPSGWENGRNTATEKDNVVIHGIPYSEHSSFSELVRFVKFLKPKQIVPTVEITGGIATVQKYFPCPVVYKTSSVCQSRLTEYFDNQTSTK